MSFDLSAMLKQAEKADKADKSHGKLFCAILGPSGSGKSHTLGTSGEKTLLLTFIGEKHGVQSARREGGSNITPLFLNLNEETGESLTPDQTLAKLRNVLASDISALGFKAVALDGLTELDECISSSTELKNKCLTSSGKVDGFRTSGETKKIASKIVNDLAVMQQRNGIHVFVTCIVDVKEYEDNGQIVECNPRLTTYSLAEGLLQLFGDRVIVTPVTNSKGERKHIFDFSTDMKRASKDQHGRVKKMFNFSPRLSTGKIPESGFILADLKELLKCKVAK